MKMQFKCTNRTTSVAEVTLNRLTWMIEYWVICETMQFKFGASIAFWWKWAPSDKDMLYKTCSTFSSCRTKRICKTGTSPRYSFVTIFFKPEKNQKHKKKTKQKIMMQPILTIKQFGVRSVIVQAKIEPQLMQNMNTYVRLSFCWFTVHWIPNTDCINYCKEPKKKTKQKNHMIT